MVYPFPSEAWLTAFAEALNSDARYAEIARNWEGDVLFSVEGESGEPKLGELYLDLWHGKCRRSQAFLPGGEDPPKPIFTISAPLANFMKVLQGELDPMQAMLTRRLRVQGNMAYMLRHIPTVLDFVRVARTIEITGTT